MSEIIKIAGRIVVSAYYDYQAVRIACANRIRDIIRKKAEGIDFNEVEEKKETKDYQKKYKDEDLLKLWTDLLIQKKITKEEHDYVLKFWKIAQENETLETKHQNLMKNFVAEEPIYMNFLEKIRGIGPVLSANLIKEFGDCSQYATTSKLWANCGQAVIDGKSPKLKKGESAKFNPKLKMLSWKISDSLLKQNKGYYRKTYDEEKEKQLNKSYIEGELEAKYGKPYKKEDLNLSKGHAHNRALRKMRKRFLSHYWEASRELVGLPHEKTYVEGILKHDHIVSWRDAIKMENSLLDAENQLLSAS